MGNPGKGCSADEKVDKTMKKFDMAYTVNIDRPNN